MKAIKENKVYTITETQKDAYLSQGFDITDDKGEIIEHSPKSTVQYSEYEKLLAENKKISAENAKLKAERKGVDKNADKKDEA